MGGRGVTGMFQPGKQGEEGGGGVPRSSAFKADPLSLFQQGSNTERCETDIEVETTEPGHEVNSSEVPRTDHQLLFPSTQNTQKD